MKLTSAAYAIPLMAFLLAGCTEGPGTIFNQTFLDSGNEPGPSITTGARQRLISNTTTGVASVPGRVHARRILCVEPSPDVAVAVANSFGVGVSVLGQGSGSLSGTQIEGVAQLAERTVAIQALLKQGYQACLDYANGAITGTTYSLRTARLDDLLITLVLAENASGAFGRSGAFLGTKASASAEASLTDLAKAGRDVADKQKDLAAAEEDVLKKEDEVEKAQTAFDAAADDKKETENAKLEASKAELRAAEAKRNSILQQLQASTDTLAKSAGEVTKAQGAGGLTAQPSGEIAQVLGDMQSRFLDKKLDQAYISTCLTELGHRKVPTRQDKEFRDVVLAGVKTSDPQTNPIGGLQMEAFFLGSHLADKTELTEHCNTYLDDFVQQSTANRHERDLKTLELEKSRIALLTKQAAVSAKSKAKVIHPSATLNHLKADIAALIKQRGALHTQKIPAATTKFTATEHAAITQAKAAQIQKADALINQGTNASTGAKVATIKALEDTYLSLMSDVGKDGTSIQKKLWKAEYDKRQAQAEDLHAQMRKLSKELHAATEETATLIAEIQAAKS